MCLIDINSPKKFSRVIGITLLSRNPVEINTYRKFDPEVSRWLYRMTNTSERFLAESFVCCTV